MSYNFFFFSDDTLNTMTYQPYNTYDNRYCLYKIGLEFSFKSGAALYTDTEKKYYPNNFFTNPRLPGYNYE